MIKLFEKYSQLDVKGKTLLIVDIQPAYQRWISFSMFSFIQFINKNYDKFNKIIFFFNGPEMGYENEYDYKTWLYEHEIDEEVFDYANFYDKGYNFFRTCIDAGIYEEDTVKFLKFMLNKNIHDSRYIEKKDWIEFVKLHPDAIILRDLLEGSEDCIWIPDLIDYIEDNVDDDILLCGGHATECLKEVEIALLVLNKNYQILKEFTY
jgi:hypothetical protein